MPYTRASAEQSGWRWRIPLQHRVGNGHVFSSAHIDRDTALDRLLGGLDAATIGEPRLLRFTAGRREKLWEKNCVAIGLSGGFIEPLESTSIHLIQSGIFRLMALFPDQGFSQIEIDEYNRWLVEEYEHIRDFIILHYHATERSDSDFWNHCRTMDIPDSLAAKIALWREKGASSARTTRLFTEDSWIAVLHGSEHRSPLSPIRWWRYCPWTRPTRFMGHMRDVIARTAEAMPRHEDYIAQNCAAQQTEMA